ncbi:MAG: FaeA/PapI family transcriptional regulator [Candidatus Pacearchaeota archaeon]|nr:FaeA/PapI family transcriptional regulator [Candidatus Pacearchaeota archaeon]
MVQDALQVKEKIMHFIRLRGPSLPVHISKETGLSILFASAFLSDLYSEKMIGISNLKVGSSPLYFIPGQEPQLENFSKYLKSKEKEAFLFLKEKKFLKDSELQPAIRVALREIKDFAIPFRKDEDIYWRYFTIPEEDFNPKENSREQYFKGKLTKETDKVSFEEQKPKIEEKMEIVEIKQETEIPVEQISERKEVVIIEEKKIENIFDVPKKQDESVSVHEESEQVSKKEKPKPKKKKQNNNKKDENFFNKIKEFLEKKNIEILDIKDFRNNEAVLKIKKDRKEELLFVFNQKKITEKEILKSHKKALEENLKYSILFMAETPKKLSDLIEAVRNLSEIDRIE